MTALRSITVALAALALAGCPSGPRVKPQPLEQLASPTSRPAGERAFWDGRDDLIRAPKVTAPAPLKLPRLERFELRNGLSVIAARDDQLPLVSVQLMVRAGTIDEPPGRTGLAEFTAGMLRGGVRGMDADAISRAVDRVGASLSAGSGYELSTIRCSGRSEVLDLCLRMVASLATRPTFPAAEMGQVRDRLLSAVKEVRDDPGRLADAHFDNLLYGDDHPAGRPLSETTLQRISRADLVAFHRRAYLPGAAILGVSGDVDPARLRASVKRAFGRWRAGKPPRREISPVQDPPRGLLVLLVDKPDLSQSFFTLGHAGIRRKHPDRYAVTTMNYVLGGGGFSSRLMKVVRAEGGKTYGISSAYFRAEHDGSFSVSSFTRNEQLVETLQQVVKELERIRKAPPTAAEIRAAKGKIAGGHAIRVKTTAGLVHRLMSAQMWGLSDDHVVRYALRIDRLDADQIAAAARGHVRPGTLVAAIVGKAAVVGPLLEAAKIPFTRIDYLDPISMRRRARRAAEARTPITAAEKKRAAAVIDAAVRTAGGARRLAAIQRLRVQGKAIVTARGQTLKGSYQGLMVLPDHVRLTLDIKPMPVTQVLAGKRAFVQLGPQRKDLPPAAVTALRGSLWRDPVLVLRHVARRDVRMRPSRDPELSRARRLVGVELFPPELSPVTLVFERRGKRLVQVRHADRSGTTRVTRLAAHRRVKGILVPHEISSRVGGRTQKVVLTSVEINPPISQDEIVGK